MTIKMDNAFSILDRFGQPTGNWAKKFKPSKPVEMDSIDDFNKHFEQKILNHKVDRTPDQDTFTKGPMDGGSIPNTF